MGKRTEPITAPAAMRQAHAAAHVGVSASYFLQMVETGQMPAPRIMGSVKVWIRSELEEALLVAPTDSADGQNNPCDRLLAP